MKQHHQLFHLNEVRKSGPCKTYLPAYFFITVGNRKISTYKRTFFVKNGEVVRKHWGRTVILILGEGPVCCSLKKLSTSAIVIVTINVTKVSLLLFLNSDNSGIGKIQN